MAYGTIFQILNNKRTFTVSQTISLLIFVLKHIDSTEHMYIHIPLLSWISLAYVQYLFNDYMI